MVDHDGSGPTLRRPPSPRKKRALSNKRHAPASKLPARSLSILVARPSSATTVGDTWLLLPSSSRPSTRPQGRSSPKFSDASPADVDEAVHRARRAFEAGGPWRSLLPAARARLLWSIGDLIDRHADELAELETRDQGQPIGIARHVSVAAAAEHFRYYAGWVTKIAGIRTRCRSPARSTTRCASRSVFAG